MEKKNTGRWSVHLSGRRRHRFSSLSGARRFARKNSGVIRRHRKSTPRRVVVVGFSGGVTSAWCAGWALRNYPRDEVVLLFHDTKEEHSDTYRFLYEMAQNLDIPITERSDGRSVTELFYDEGYLGNNQNTFCSRILKAEQGEHFIQDLRSGGVSEIIRVFGYSAHETKRITRMVGHCASSGVTPVFPVMRERVAKQDCAEWCRSRGVEPSAMYCWSAHANCVGCVKGGRAYWLAIHKNHPEVFEARARQEEEFGHPIIRGGGRERVTLRQLVVRGLKRKVSLDRREAITLGACDCGD